MINKKALAAMILAVSAYTNAAVAVTVEPSKEDVVKNLNIAYRNYHMLPDYAYSLNVIGNGSNTMTYEDANDSYTGIVTGTDKIPSVIRKDDKFNASEFVNKVKNSVNAYSTGGIAIGMLTQKQRSDVFDKDKMKFDYTAKEQKNMAVASVLGLGAGWIAGKIAEKNSLSEMENGYYAINNLQIRFKIKETGETAVFEQTEGNLNHYGEWKNGDEFKLFKKGGLWFFEKPQ